MKPKRSKRVAHVLEEIVFGVEDSLVSTVGALTGIAAGAQSTYVVLLSGVVLIFAEALSMTAGSYLSSKSQSEVWLKHHTKEWKRLMKHSTRGPLQSTLKTVKLSKEDRSKVEEAVESERLRWLRRVEEHERKSSPAQTKQPVFAAGVMGVSYLLAGGIPLLAYLFLPVNDAILPSVIITAIALFIFGAWKGGITERSRFWSGLEMMVIAMAAAGIAYLLGLLARNLFGLVI